ncbi:MAG: Gfo/Idh/MocA family oxidoreductase [Planctomycetes bacterium]|nr:Gfo/Idh/MocA family oxidoreductase [Planctomycetota bacterium]
MAKIHAAIIGFAGMGQRQYKALQNLGIDVVAICDWDTDKIKKNVPGFSVGRIYKDYKDILAKEKIELICIATNGPTHHEIVVESAKHGVKNIFCEKPMTTSLQKAQEMIDICKKYNVRLTVNHIRRWSVNHLKIKEIIKEGILGNIRHIYFHCGCVGLGNMVSHFFDMMRFIFENEPEWIVGFIDKTGTKNPRGDYFIDPGGYGIIKFKNNARGFVDTSEDTGVQYVYDIVGEYGRIRIDELNNIWKIRARNKKDKELPFTRYGTSMPNVPFESHGLWDIVDLTQRGVEELISDRLISCRGEDGYRSLEMVIAFHISDENNNKPVYLPIKGKDLEKDIPIT